MKHTRPLVIATTLIATASAGRTQNEAVSAEDPTVLAGVQMLDAVVVTASRFDEPLADAPNTVSIITSEEIIEKGFRTLPESFAETPGVLGQKTANGHGSPFIRGFTGFRNLLMVDGIRLNNSVFREGPNQYWNTVDAFSLERIELVKGQGSVLWGSDAIGGTVNALTKSADVSGHADGELFAGASTHYRWSSAEASHSGRVEAEIGEGRRYGLFLGYTARHFGDVRAAGVGRQPATGYDEWALDAKFDYFFSPDVKLTLAYQQVQQDDIQRAHKTIHGISWRGTTIGSERRRVLDQHRRLAYGQLEANNLDGIIDRAKISLSWHNQEEERTRVRGDGRRDVQGFDVDTLGAWTQFESDTPIGVLTYGASYYRDWVDSFSNKYTPRGSLASRGIQGPVGDDATYDLFGLFVEDRIDVTDSLDVLVGGRFTHAATDIGSVEDPATGSKISIDEDWNDFSASGKMLYRPAAFDGVEIYGGVAQGFRAPNLSDLSRLDSARSSEIETPAPGLEPEQFLNYEIGLRLTGEKIRGGLAYYYTDIDDMIVRAPTGRVIDGEFEVTKRNAGDGFVQGIELDGEIDIAPRWTVFGALTWMEGEADTFPTSSPKTKREPISRIMPVTGVLGLRWDATDNVWLEVVGRAAERADNLNTRDRSDTQRIPPEGTPGYVTLGLRGGWAVNEQLILNAAVENVTDEEYRIHGSGQNEPGVNFILSATVNF